VLLAQKELKPAADVFRSTLKLKPDLAEGHRGLGQCQQDLGEVEQAAESYRRALAINGNDIISLNNLAWILAETRKDPDAALPLAARAAELAPQAAEVLDTLGWVHYRRGAYAEAEKILGRASERAPESAVVQYHLGATYAKLGRKEEAVLRLRRAIRLDAGLAKAEKIERFISELGG
jgi:tetratricopeptide (TPR) repeat protein